MPTARLARTSDLGSLMHMFGIAEVSAVVQPLDRAEAIWQEMLDRPGVAIFVSERGDAIAATCSS